VKKALKKSFQKENSRFGIRKPAFLSGISIIMPALNEEKNIRAAVSNVFRALKKYNLRGDVVVVDDGSTDQTPIVLTEIKKEFAGLQVIRNNTPSGIGGAFLSGVMHARRKAVVMIPGDDENKPEDVLKYLDLIDRVDIVVPFVHNSELRNRWRRLISSFFRFIISTSFGTSLNYYNGNVIYKTRVIQSLPIRSRGFFYQAEILIRALRKGALFAEVPVFLKNRSFGVSKAVSFKSLRSVAIDFLCLFWEIHFQRVEGA